MSDYVPGPWYAKKTGIVTFYKTRRIQVATARQPLFTAECQEANARLIAAAPETTEALQALLWAVTGFGDFEAQYPEEYAKARAAIAKARGK